MFNIEFVVLFICLIIMLIIFFRWFSRYQLENSLSLALVKTESKPASGLTNYLQTLNVNLPTVLVVIGIMIVAIAVFVLLLNIFPNHLPVAGIAAMAATVFCFNTISDLAKWKIQKVEKGLAEAMDMMKAALTSGQSPQQAVSLAARSSTGVIKLELTEMLNRLGMGCEPEQALRNLTTKYNCAATRLFAQVIIARQHSGSDLSFMLNSVNRIIQDRQRHQLQIDTHLSGTRYAALLCGILPYLLVPVLLWKQPDWFDTLLQHPVGPTYLGGALFLQFMGYLWLRRIARIEQ